MLTNYIVTKYPQESESFRQVVQREVELQSDNVEMTKDQKALHLCKLITEIAFEMAFAENDES